MGLALIGIMVGVDHMGWKGPFLNTNDLWMLFSLPEMLSQYCPLQFYLPNNTALPHYCPPPCTIVPPLNWPFDTASTTVLVPLQQSTPSEPPLWQHGTHSVLSLPYNSPYLLFLPQNCPVTVQHSISSASLTMAFPQYRPSCSAAFP